MKEIIRKLIQGVLTDLESKVNVEILVDYPKNEQFGDYTTNVAMMLAKKMGKNPMETANRIISNLKFPISNFFEKVEAVEPGYINFYLSPKYFWDKVEEINKLKVAFGDSPSKEKKVMIEYSQPNTHKEFHIGHLRNVIIGSAIVATTRKAGYPVVAANYFGDIGSHIAKCLWGLEKFHADENLEKIPDRAEFLGKVYSEAVQAIEKNPELENEFKDLQNKLESGDEKLTELWKKTREWSLGEFDRIYEILGVKFDALFYESQEEQAGIKILPELIEKGIAKESQGAIIADLEKYGLGVLVLRRKDGSVLYGLKDIPLAIEKFDKYKIDRSVVITDVRQSFYFRQLFKILELYGFRKQMCHVGFEAVSLKGGEMMSSRKGNVVTAQKIFSEMIRKVKDQFLGAPYPEEIALGAVKFFMLKYSSGSRIEFDMDEALKLEGATGPYVQYAHARICSILSKAGSEKLKSQKQANFSLLSRGKEIGLMRELNKFPELVEEIGESYEVHKLPHYAIRLADKFHSFYDECRVIDEAKPELTQARIELISATRIVLAETLRLIGVGAPARM